jgi:hypothetical protein
MKQSSTNNHQSSIINSERRWVLGFALVVMLITSIPYFVGYSVQGDDWRFTGFVFGVEDGNTYIGKMLRGAQGDWLFRTPYSAFDQRGVFAYIPYLVLGKLSSSPGQHEQLVAIYHFFRIVAGVLAILAMYDFIALFVKKVHLRYLGVVLSTLGGGLGWILVLLGRNWWLGNLPLEYYSPESFGFLILFGLPHLAMARALFFWGFRIFISKEESKGGHIAGLLWLFMGGFQPITIVLVWTVIGAYSIYLLGLWVWQRWRNISTDWICLREWFSRFLWAVSIPLPLVIYTYISFTLDPVVREIAAQNLILSPHPFHYLIAYGAVLPFCFVGLLKQFKSEKPGDWLVSVWFVIFPILVYAPYSLQRRLAEGFWVVLIVLALVSFESDNRFFYKIRKFILVFSIPSTFFIFSGGFSAAFSTSAPLFRSFDEVTAFEYLDKNAGEGNVVLSAYETGNAIPAWAPVFVVIGHRPESAGITELTPRVEAFYQLNTSDDDRLSLLNQFDVGYVFWGPAERDYGGWHPSSATYLELVFRQGVYEIYKVVSTTGE